MRIDPAQLSEPLAHILGAGKADAAQGQRATAAATSLAPESQFEQLDKLLLRRLRATAVSDAAGSVTTAADAQERIARVRALMMDDPSVAGAAQADLDRARLGGLLGDS